MKKLIFVIIVLAVAVPLFAQTVSEENSSDYYYLNIRILKIYPSSSGYIIQYSKGISGVGTVGIPNEWFTHAGGKADIVSLPAGKNWPTMTVFYKKGEFSHVRIYVHKSKAHETWGNIPQSADVSKHFANTETIKIEFE